eukprot:m.128162 g.128162  ORF g.128162 m.128162 type:complete len:579 (-) comp29319_c0_seq1:198-1934(-)
MHGRVKIRTTEEQEAAKEKERQEKVKKYLYARQMIAAKRAESGVDEMSLAMITKLLSTLPEFGTLWNWRREGFEKLWKDMDDDLVQKNCEVELDFLNSCLKQNPKAYGVWQQRRWVMQRSPKPSWSNELENCNMFLKLDSRNFHCWDYRRFVVATADKDQTIDTEAELDYTMEKIGDNFSNYSAWHYRSTLLPKVKHVDEHGYFEADVLAEEFENVTSAFYIDPCDQSAWFYHRWLLGREETLPTVCAIVTVRQPTFEISLVLSQPANINNELITFTLNGAAIVATLTSKQTSTSLWCASFDPLTLSSGSENEVHVKLGEGAIESLGAIKTPAAVFTVKNAFKEDGKLTYQLSPTELRSSISKYRIPSKTLLEEQLKSCNELTEELDEGPERKWALLAIVYIMRGVDALGYRDDITNKLQLLEQIDPKRTGYYKDTKSRYAMEDYVCDLASKGAGVNVSMQALGLTLIEHTHHLCLVETLDLSNNLINQLANMSMLRRLKTLVLDNNQIPGVYGEQLAGLENLQEISLRNNCIKSLRGLSGLMRDVVPTVTKIFLSGNPVCDIEGYNTYVSSHIAVAD